MSTVCYCLEEVTARSSQSPQLHTFIPHNEQVRVPESTLAQACATHWPCFHWKLTLEATPFAIPGHDHTALMLSPPASPHTPAMEVSASAAHASNSPENHALRPRQCNDETMQRLEAPVADDRIVASDEQVVCELAQLRRREAREITACRRMLQHCVNSNALRRQSRLAMSIVRDERMHDKQPVPCEDDWDVRRCCWHGGRRRDGGASATHAREGKYQAS